MHAFIIHRKYFTPLEKRNLLMYFLDLDLVAVYEYTSLFKRLGVVALLQSW